MGEYSRKDFQDKLHCVPVDLWYVSLYDKRYSILGRWEETKKGSNFNSIGL